MGVCGVGPHCSFCDTFTGPFTEVEGLFAVSNAKLGLPIERPGGCANSPGPGPRRNPLAKQDDTAPSDLRDLLVMLRDALGQPPLGALLAAMASGPSGCSPSRTWASA